MSLIKIEKQLMNKGEMDAIMQERIKKFNQFVMNMDTKGIPIGLYYGKMGICIYFYELARLTSRNEYTVFAERLLDEVLNETNDYTAVDPENGLSGICQAINYLLINGFIQGNPNVVLKCFDDRIIRSLLFNRVFDDQAKITIGLLKLSLGSLHYLATRLENRKLPHNEKFIIQNVIIEYINKFETYSVDKFVEPNFYSITGYFIPLYLQLLQKLYNLNFYNYKIEKIFDELSPKVKCLFPFLGSNRLLLSSKMRDVNEVRNTNGWKEHILLLEDNTNINISINEFRNRNILFYNGLSGFYYLLKSRGKEIEDKDLLIQKIVTSEIWEAEFKNEDALKEQIGLYTGFSGVILTYLDIMFEKRHMYFDIIL